MKLNSNDMTLKSEENESGIIEIQLKLENAEWKIIGNKKRWIGHCPVCNTEVTYSQKVGLKRALEENRVCLVCRQEKIKSTCLIKYGTTSPLATRSILEKTKKTCKDRYGEQHPFQVNEIQHKVKNTLFKKYGVNSPSKIASHKQKIQDKRKSGSWNGWLEKTKKTLMERYGDENYNNHEKCKKTLMERYGVDSVLKIPGMYNKMLSSVFKNHGKSLSELQRLGYKNKDTRIELKMRGILERLNISYDREFHIHDQENKKHRFFDFKLKDLNVLIECDGDYWHSLPHNIINDKYKSDLAKKNGYILLRFKESNIVKEEFECVFIDMIKNYLKNK